MGSIIFSIWGIFYLFGNKTEKSREEDVREAFMSFLYIPVAV